MPVTLLSFLVAPVSGKLAERLGVRWFIAGGLALVGAGLPLMGGLQAGDDWTALLAGFMVAGGGIGMVNPALATAAVGVVDPRRAGMASGINSTFRQVGIATGIAALGTVFQSHLTSALGSGLQGTPAGCRAGQLSEALSAAPLDRIVQAVPPGARDVVRQRAEAAFVSSLDHVYLLSAGIAIVGAILAGLLIRGKDLAGGAPEPAAQPQRPRIGAEAASVSAAGR
jgi:MFS family permease